MLEWLQGRIPDVLAAVAVAGGVLAFLCTLWGFASVRSRRLTRFVACSLLAFILTLMAALSGAVSAGIRGYRNLTHEEVAARIQVQPLGPQQFQARFELPDGRRPTFTLAGDELYVDARILKWKWVATWFGLHTQYELDRVTGRYRELEDERTKERTVHGLAPSRRIDLFRLARAQARLSRLLDAEYGSASFVPADRPAVYELRVSATGLLIRPEPAAGRGS